MDLWIIVIVLLVIAIGLLIFSYFKKDDSEKIKEEVEDLSLQMMQDVFQVKKRLATIEKSLNIENQTPESGNVKVHKVLRNHVTVLYTQGVELEKIAQQAQLPIDTVEQIIREYLEENN